MRLLLILFSLIFVTFLYSQRPTSYLYAQVDTSSTFHYPFEYGEIIIQKNSRFKKNAFSYSSSDTTNAAFIETIKNELQSLPKKRRNILFFIHGMMGHRDSYLSLVANTLDEGLYKKKENKYGMVVYLIWRAGMNYGKNITQTLKIGEQFADLIKEVDKESKNWNRQTEISVMCHSMGNRVFQGIYNKYAEAGIISPPFKDVILAAADLESDILKEGQPLENIGVMAEEIHVYFHEYDRTLMMSQILNQTDRMGLKGVAGIDSIDGNISIIDASYLEDQESLPGKYGNHRYFFTSPTVREDMLNSLHNKNGSQLPYRKTLDHPQKFALIKE